MMKAGGLRPSKPTTMPRVYSVELAKSSPQEAHGTSTKWPSTVLAVMALRSGGGESRGCNADGGSGAGSDEMAGEETNGGESGEGEAVCARLGGAEVRRAFDGGRDDAGDAERLRCFAPVTREDEAWPAATS